MTSFIPPEIAEVFTKAADYMEVYGKAEDEYESATGSVCAIGAICRAIGDKSSHQHFPQILRTDAYRKVREVLGERLNIGSVPTWSDYHTETEVITTLRDLGKIK